MKDIALAHFQFQVWWSWCGFLTCRDCSVKPGGSESPFSTPQTTPLRPALRGPFGGSRGVSKEKINPRLSQEENSSDQNHLKFLLMVINGYHYMLLLLSCYDKTLLSQVATVAIGFPNSSSSELWWCNFGEEIHSSSRRLRK